MCGLEETLGGVGVDESGRDLVRVDGFDREADAEVDVDVDGCSSR